MIREQIGTVVLRFYPAEIRVERGEEMLGTLLDAGERSWAAFAREGTSLAVAGARERARVSATIGLGELASDSLRWAAMLWMAVNLSGVTGAADGYPRGVHGLLDWMVLLWPILTFALLQYDRLAGLCGIGWVGGLRTPIAHGPFVPMLAGSVVPLLGFFVMAGAPRRQRPDPRQLGWLLPILLISLFTGDADGVLGIGFGPLGAPALAVVSIAAVLVLVVDVRLVVACSLVWASAGLMYAEIDLHFGNPLTGTALLVVCPPAVILTATVHRRMQTTRNRMTPTE